MKKQAQLISQLTVDTTTFRRGKTKGARIRDSNLDQSTVLWRCVVLCASRLLQVTARCHLAARRRGERKPRYEVSRASPAMDSSSLYQTNCVQLLSENGVWLLLLLRLLLLLTEASVGLNSEGTTTRVFVSSSSVRAAAGLLLAFAAGR